jgi:hypothetical protein
MKNQSVHVIKPPAPIFRDSDSTKPSIFLAGSIEMGKAEDWQKKAIQFYEENGVEVVVYSPRREDWDSSWEQTFENANFYQQVNWELTALEEATLIIMYFDPNTKSPISLLELGKFADSDKLLVCCPEGFWRKGNVDIVCDRYHIPNYSKFDDLLQASLQILENHE